MGAYNMDVLRMLDAECKDKNVDLWSVFDIEN